MSHRCRAFSAWRAVSGSTTPLQRDAFNAGWDAAISAAVEAIKQRDDLLAALDRLAFAAECRDNTSGDPARLIEVKAELQAASAEANAVAARIKGATS